MSLFDSQNRTSYTCTTERCADESQTDTHPSGTIPESNRYSDEATYGRPRYVVSFYSENINAHAMKTFETKHDAVGQVVVGLREGWMKRPSVKYEYGYGKDEYIRLEAFANSWD